MCVVVETTSSHPFEIGDTVIIAGVVGLNKDFDATVDNEAAGVTSAVNGRCFLVVEKIHDCKFSIQDVGEHISNSLRRDDDHFSNAKRIFARESVRRGTQDMADLQHVLDQQSFLTKCSEYESGGVAALHCPAGILRSVERIPPQQEEETTGPTRRRSSMFAMPSMRSRSASMLSNVNDADSDSDENGVPELQQKNVIGIVKLFYDSPSGMTAQPCDNRFFSKKAEGHDLILLLQANEGNQGHAGHPTQILHDQWAKKLCSENKSVLRYDPEVRMIVPLESETTWTVKAVDNDLVQVVDSSGKTMELVNTTNPQILPPSEKYQRPIIELLDEALFTDRLLKRSRVLLAAALILSFAMVCMFFGIIYLVLIVSLAERLDVVLENMDSNAALFFVLLPCAWFLSRFLGGPVLRFVTYDEHDIPKYAQYSTDFFEDDKLQMGYTDQVDQADDAQHYKVRLMHLNYTHPLIKKLRTPNPSTETDEGDDPDPDPPPKPTFTEFDPQSSTTHIVAVHTQDCCTNCEVCNCVRVSRVVGRKKAVTKTGGAGDSDVPVDLLLDLVDLPEAPVAVDGNGFLSDAAERNNQASDSFCGAICAGPDFCVDGHGICASKASVRVGPKCRCRDMCTDCAQMRWSSPGCSMLRLWAGALLQLLMVYINIVFTLILVSQSLFTLGSLFGSSFFWRPADLDIALNPALGIMFKALLGLFSAFGGVLDVTGMLLRGTQAAENCGGVSQFMLVIIIFLLLQVIAALFLFNMFSFIGLKLRRVIGESVAQYLCAALITALQVLVLQSSGLTVNMFQVFVGTASYETCDSVDAASGALCVPVYLCIVIFG
jgi:hypothetical protein